MNEFLWYMKLGFLYSKLDICAGPCTAGSQFFSKQPKCQNNGKATMIKKAPFCQCNCPNLYMGDYCEKGLFYVN